MKKIISCILLAMVLLASAVPMAVMPAAAQQAGIPCDDGDNELTRDELVSAILPYMLGEGSHTLDDVGDASWVYAYWSGEPKTITDSATRDVTLCRPVERIIVLNSDSARAVRILGVEDSVVGISKTVQDHPFYFPEMSQKPVVGTWKEVVWEDIVTLEPDLVIAYATGTINADLAEENLKPFGITVVGLYLYVTSPYDKILNEFEELAKLLEKEGEAQRYIGWHDEYETRVQEFVEDKEKPDIFMTYTAGAIGKTTEIKTYGPGTIDYTLCEKAGGRSITENLTPPIPKYPTVDAEWVAAEDPDVIIMKCGNVFGWWDSETEPESLINNLLEGKGWDNLNATMNDSVYVVPWSITNGFEHIYGVVLLAKIFYPELDIEPTEVYEEFLEEFLRVEYPEGEGKVFVYPEVEE